MSANAQNTHQHQCSQNQNLGPVPTSSNFTDSVLLASLPEASDGRCSSSRVTGDEITRANGSSQVRGFWQVLTLVATCEDGAVPSRSGRRPAGDLFAGRQDQSQSPLRINSSNGSNWDQIGLENVFDYNNILANLDSGKPKEQQAHVADGCCNWQREQHAPETISCEHSRQSHTHGSNDDYCENSRGFRDKNLHRPSFTFTERFMA